ncbi:MAG: uracil-DNA glycosylase [Massilia sp.]
MQARLSSAIDLTGFRNEARDLLAHQVPPEQVHWETDVVTEADLFAQPVQGSDQARPSRSIPRAATAIVPSSFLRLCEVVVLHHDAQRFSLLYRLLWRLVHEPNLRNDPIDPDMLQAQQMAQSVRRDMHKMKAFLRFRQLPDQEHPGEVLHVAWFEPVHHIVEAVAPWFARRFAGMRWAILTPERSVRWDGRQLMFGPGGSRADAPAADAGEALWLTYYRSIFNPARVNAQLMQSHIPSRFWKNLPEGAIVPAMVSNAELGARSTGQAQAVGRKTGATIPIAPADAQPERQQPSKLDECRRCDLWQFATQAVPGAGPKRAPIMLVGEQPGDQEDLAGEAFVGPAGKLLDRVFDAAGLERRTIYLTNAVKHFKWEPRGKRRLHKTPAQREVDACHYWLDKELVSVKPKVIVALGATALKSVLGNGNAKLGESLGKAIQHDGRWVVTVYHPSYILRVPDEEAKRQAFNVMVEGLKLAQQLLERQPEEPKG